MSKNPKIEQLRRVPLFAQCSKRELAGLAALVDELDLAEGETLALEGERGKEFLVLADGIADVESGGEVVNRLGPGDFFGEISLVTGGPRTATVTTRSPSKLFIFSAPAFRSLLHDAPGIKSRVLAAAALRLAR
ncbi:MAG: cyclic nucleotide-binding domain-containing protein [Gaiellaceae bacterium]